MDLNKVIHEKNRLRIISTLVSLKPDEKVDFGYLKKTLSFSDGNLSTHLRVLENEGYIEIKKQFIGRRPKTFYWVSAKGREAFAEYIETLQNVLFGNKG